MPQIFLLQPSETKDYEADWSAQLGSDTIATSTWSIPTGITKTSDTNTTTTTTVWLNPGATAKGTYYGVNTVTTAGGRTLIETLELVVLPVPVTTDYCTLAQLKSDLRITDTTDDTQLALCISAASRAIEQNTGRYFYQRGTIAVPEVRYYDSKDQNVLWLDDCVSISKLETDDNDDGTYETTWTANTDYVLGPYNAALQAEPEPYQWAERLRNGNYYFPYRSSPFTMQYHVLPESYQSSGQHAVKITGVWGWPQVPSDITRACLLQAARYYKRAEAIFGVEGTSAFGAVNLRIPLDPDVVQIINNRRKNWFA